MTEFVTTNGTAMVVVDLATDVLTIHLPADDCDDIQSKALAMIMCAVRLDNEPAFLAMMLDWARVQGIDFDEISQH